MEITARNTNDLAAKVYRALEAVGVHDQSRNGPVLRFDGPVTICLTHPWERVNYCPVRDANPFFHVMESVAMLANWNSVRLLSYFAKNMVQYSDNGRTYNAFYGTRARCYHGLDQLRTVVETLRKDPGTRQAVICLWEPEDLTIETKDKACNLVLIFAIRNGVLEMTTFNRSNDAIWGGVTGANIVHLSFFHEYVARAVNVTMGRWWHTSANLHVYLDNPKVGRLFRGAQQPFQEWVELGGGSPVHVPLFPVAYDREFDLYAMGLCQIAEHCIGLDLTHEETVAKVLDAMSGCPDEMVFLHGVAVPMFLAWHARKCKADPAPHLEAILDDRWRAACEAWCARHPMQEVANA